MRDARDGLLLISNYSNRTGYAWNNIHRLFREIARHFHSHGVNVFVSFSQLEPPVDCVDSDYVKEILQLPPMPNRLGSLLHVMRIIRSRNIRYLYFTDQRIVSWHYAVYRLCGVKRIIVHSRISVADPSPALPERGLKGILKYTVARLPMVGADRVYAVSDFVRNRVIAKARFPANRTVTILNGVNVSQIPGAPPVDHEGALRIACAARATEYKGIHVLINAAATLRNRYHKQDFLIEFAGDGPDIGLFRELVEDLDLEKQFVFLGELDSCEALFERADIIVVPSIWGDACPSSVAEALAWARPLVATRVGGVPEQVGMEENALLVPPNDADALATALAQLLQDPEMRARLGFKGRRRAEEALDQSAYHRTVLQHLSNDLSPEASRLEMSDS
jgi:glycosyltransferase involved in cell wall biosynthesis